MGVGKTGVLIRIIVSLALVLAVTLPPEGIVNQGLSLLSTLLFLLMAFALVFPWRNPDLLGWEFLGLFTTLSVLFGVASAQLAGLAPPVMPIAYRIAIRSALVIFEAGVLTGLVRVGRMRLRMRASETIVSGDDEDEDSRPMTLDMMSDH